MRTYIISLVFAMCSLGLFAQSQTVNVQIGAVYEIGKPTTNTYKHINFPKPNTIIKRGGIANYKRVKGCIVVVSAIEKKKDGSNVIKIKRKDGGRFFGSHHVVEANFNDALASGELIAK